MWAALNPQRRVAARQWISHVAWRRRRRAGIVPLGEPRPHHLHEHDRFQPAFWPGDEMNRTAAPVWVPLLYNQQLLTLADVDGETVARRTYAPLMI